MNLARHGWGLVLIGYNHYNFLTAAQFLGTFFAMWPKKYRFTAITLALLSGCLIISLYALRIPALEAEDTRLTTTVVSLFAGTQEFQAIAPDSPSIEQGFRHLSDPLSLINIAVITLLCIAAFLWTVKLKILRAFVVSMAAGVLQAVIAGYAGQKGIHLSIIYPLGGTFLSFGSAAVLRKTVHSAKAMELQSLLTSCLPEKMINRIANDPGLLQTEGQDLTVTVLFSNINKFSAFAEKQHPKFVVKFLNQYLAAMTNVIRKHDGSVNKFLGGGIMAFWGAPVAQQNHSESAVSCALAMSKMFAQLEKNWKKAGIPSLSFRTGINTGEVIAGTIGIPGQKTEYTVLGGTVSMAAALEDAAKMFGVGVIVGESTYSLTKGQFIYRELDYIKAADRDKPVRIYELLGPLYDREKDILESIAKKFERALGLYRAGNWPDALAAFEIFSSKRPEDQAAKIFQKRCEVYIKNPPPVDWDGIFEGNINSP